MSGKFLPQLVIALSCLVTTSCMPKERSVTTLNLDSACTLDLDVERSVFVRQSGSRQYFSHDQKNDFFVDTSEAVEEFQELLVQKGMKYERVQGPMRIHRYLVEGVPYSGVYVIWTVVGSDRGIVFSEHDVENGAGFESLLRACIGEPD